MKIYVSPIVKEIEKFYGDILLDFDHDATVYHYLHRHAKRLWHGIEDHYTVLEQEIKNYHPEYIAGDGESFFKNNLKKEDARLTVAREYGFSRWKKVKKHGKKKFDLEFEEAIENLLNGEIKVLEKMLMDDPKLISKRSKFGHEATLLHYTASNGVELWRQRVPLNLPDITRLLLDYGADKKAKMRAYGSEFDTLALLESSTHPFDAGIGEEMIKILS